MKDTWEYKWIEDIDFLRDNLIENHCNLFHNIKEKEFLVYIDDLKKSVNELDFNDMKVELSRIVASIGDAHTALAFPVKYFLPIEFYCFKYGVYITEGFNGYDDIKNHKVLKINHTKIEDILEDLREIISHENQSFFRCNVVQYLKATEVLYGALIIDDINEVTVTLEDIRGKVKTRTIKALEIKELKEIINNKQCLSIENPLYRKNKDKLYWREYIESNKTLYFKYNSCRDMEDLPIEKFIKDTMNFIEDNHIERLAVDFRDNLGGDSTLLEPFIEYIKNNHRLNKKHRLFVIIGRKTFSSALLNVYDLKNNTEALIIGEATGGKPNCYGEIKRFNLPNSGFSVSYSTKFYKVIDDDKVKTLLPDVIIEETIDDFINNIDPVMEYIKEL
ncbi:peptidase S41 [Clostridium sp.]|uniref:peptidase S41 n=1 Tax=Clostridium sp. TaxID=1506 RepID=UPI0034641158